jgi:hypothetical protein
MKILIKRGEKVLNEMNFGQWANARGDERYFALIDGILDLESDVADWNLDQQCKSNDLRAEIVS